MRNIVIFLIGIICFMFLAGCGNQGKHITSLENNTTYKAVVVNNIQVDNYFVTGINTEHFQSMPKKVLVIGANESELLMDLGVEQSIAMAVNHQDNKVFGIKQSNQAVWNELPHMLVSQLNMEQVLQLAPDLIVAQQEFFSKNRLGSTEYWNKKGIYTMVPPNTTAPGKQNEPETIQKEMDFIIDMGRIFHKEERAQEIVQNTYSTIEYIQSQVKNSSKPTVMILDDISIMASYGRNKIAGDMVTQIGGIVPDTTAAVSNEIIMNENPDIVFIVTYGDEEKRLEKINTTLAFQNLNFIKNKRVYPIPLKYVYGPGVRTVDALQYMARCMYPNILLKDRL